MPYIKKEDRCVFNDWLNADEAVKFAHPGELNYLVSMLCHQYLEDVGGLNYRNLNELMGVLECVKSELYATVVRPYEEQKISENGNLDTSIVDSILSFPKKCVCK